MLRRLLHILFLLSAFVLTTKAGVSHYNKERPMIFGIDMDYPPMEYVDEQGTPKGYDIVFTHHLMERLGIPLTYSPNTWHNIAGDVLSGRVDLGMMVYSPYRKDITNYSRAIFRLYYQILYRKDSESYYDLRHLNGKSVAFMASRPVRDTLASVGAIIHEIENLPQAITDLSSNKYDAVICFRYQTRYFLDKLKINNLEAEDLALSPREYCYVSHDRELIEAINIELKKMEEEGIIDAVYGDVYTSFGGIKIPDWIWYLILSLVFGFMVTFIVFQQRYQRKLRLEMERARLSERMKTVFLGNVSHALRTPLNAIIGFSDVLQSPDGHVLHDDERQKMIGLINSNGKQLLNFINEILELSHIEGMDLSVGLSVINLEDVIRGYLREMEPMLQPGVVVKAEFAGDKNVLVSERLLRIVTKHFLENAARHTYEGSISLSSLLTSNELYISVKDTGSGVPEQLRANIFQLLSDKSTYVQDEVPGLGLTICKAIVERCGGQIGFESPQEGGALFWFRVPVTSLNDEKGIKGKKK